MRPPGGGGGLKGLPRENNARAFECLCVCACVSVWNITVCDEGVDCVYIAVARERERVSKSAGVLRSVSAGKPRA